MVGVLRAADAAGAALRSTRSSTQQWHKRVSDFKVDTIYQHIASKL
ncbi:hypothetical protein [Mucilaginibacter koreensis]